MRRYILIVLMLVVVQDQVPVREFLKLPMLIMHYHEHQLKNQNISFSEFLAMHYAQDDDHDNDRYKDMQLPFKHIHTSSGVVSNVPSAMRFEFKQKLYDLGEKTKTPKYILFIPLYLSGKIWQPPKLA